MSSEASGVKNCRCGSAPIEGGGALEGGVVVAVFITCRTPERHGPEEVWAAVGIAADGLEAIDKAREIWERINAREGPN